MDYSSVALRIIYAREGMELPDDKDLYDIGLPNWSPGDDPRRKIIKTYVNAILNDEAGNYRLPKTSQAALGVGHKVLREMVFERHKPISHLFNSGVGLDAQFIDSQIAEHVMLSMLHEEVLVLPIHDSFIVRAGYAAWLREDMKKAFREIVEADVSLTIEGSRGNEHFGMSDEEFQEATKEPSVISFGDPEVWDAFVMSQDSMMGRYLGSWKITKADRKGKV
jgi:hypothetical protein